MMSCKEIAATYKSVLKRFVCVYQIQFDTFLAPGIGDYLRGCLCMLQLLETMNKHCGSSVQFEMDVRNHPMSKWLSLPEGYDVRSDISYKSLTNFHIDTLEVKRDEEDIAYRHVLKCIVDRVNKEANEETYAFMCRAEVFADISESHKAFIRSRLMPSPTMELHIQTTMAELGIVSGEYSVLHIRTRDEYTFPPKPLPASFLNVVKDSITDPSKKYLLITSHKGVKDALICFPNIYTKLGSKMCHVGQEVSPSDEAVRDTMTDFFLLSRAKDIVGISPYGISGFSNECAKIYNVPYKSIPITDPPKQFFM